jgi:hypothetical protein
VEPHGSEKCTERATNCPFHRVLENKSTYGKDRQRYALYLTVFGFPAGAHLKKTVRNTVKSSSYAKRKTARPYKTLLVINAL